MKVWTYTARTAAALAATLAAITGLTTPVAAADPVEPKLSFDRPLVPVSESAPTVHLLLDFAVAPPAGTDSVRPPLNLSLVLDRSGSMEDARKIEYLREAALLAVGRLTSRDRIAVVEYDDQITVMWKSQPASELARLKQAIRALTPRGSTDLAGGLVGGIEQARPHVGGDRVTRVILMTDGLANHGQTDPAEIRRIAREAKGKGVRIATIGLGLDFNETLLQAIAETGGGTYYYVENPKQMARIFDQELKALTTTVAKDAVLRITVGAGVRGVRVYGVPSRTEGATTILDLEDFFAGEQRSILLRLDLAAASAPGPQALGSVELAYLDAAASTRRRFEAPLTVEAVAEATAAENAVNKAVAAQATLAQAGEVQAAAIARFEAGQAEEATKMLDNLRQDLAQRNQSLQDATLQAKVEALEVDSERMAAAPAPSAPAAQATMKAQRALLYSAGRGKTGGMLLKPGDQGPEVERLVEALIAAGLLTGSVRDRYDEAVETAVRTYQQKQGLTDDGVAGPATLNRLSLY